jgi:threonine dehydrogenase-like Zn-dependent dehydrogenase
VLVVCHGAPSIAIYAAQAALAVGAGTVTFESDDASILAVAESVGATGVLTSFDRRRGRWPIVVDCGQRPAVLQHAIASTEPDGVLHSVSYYAAPREIGLALGKLYTRASSSTSGGSTPQPCSPRWPHSSGRAGSTRPTSPRTSLPGTRPQTATSTPR